MAAAKPTYDELLARVAELEQQRLERVSAPAEANEALREAEELYRQVVERASDGIVVHTGQKIVFANPAFAAMSGYSPAELEGIECLKLVPREQHQLIADRARRRLAGEHVPDRYGLDLLRKDGTVFSVDLKASAITYHNEPHDLAILRDVTGRRRAEQELRDSNELLSLFVRYSPIYAYIKTVTPSESRVLQASDNFQHMIGVSGPEMVGKTMVELFPAEMAAKMTSDDWKVVATGELLRLDEDLDGRNYTTFKFPIVQGTKTFLAGYSIDITERRRAEEALRESEARFRSVLESSRDVIFRLNIQTGRYEYVSPSAEAVVGISAEELMALDVEKASAMIHPDDLPAVRAAHALTEKTGRGEAEYRVRTKTGSYRWLSNQMSVVRDGSGRPVYRNGNVRDITERKRAEAQLAQADRLASMGMMAAGVGHEINNPLTYLLYNVQSLAQDIPRLTAVVRRCCSALRDALGPEAVAKVAAEDAALLQPAALREMADRVQDALEGARRIKSVTRSLNAFARSEHLEVAWVDLTIPVESAVKMASNEIRHRARLVKDFGEIPNVWASEGKLAQVFLNLLVNAAHSIEEGHADENVIQIKTWAEGEEVFAEIKDTGAGIAPENLERVFEPFFTTKATGRGAGLGLSICRTLLTGMGGDLRVESELGQGSRFIARLPVKPQALASAPGSTVTDRPAAPVIRGRILVVDDEEAIRRVLAQLLERDHEVVTAASGKEGRAILLGDPAFDVILCDLMMPEVTGMDLHAWLVKEHPILARRTVFITGGVFTPKAETYLATVGNARIEKPFNAAALMKLLAEKIVTARSGG